MSWSKRQINRIVWHCSATSQKATPESILQYWLTPKAPPGGDPSARYPYIPGKQGGKGWKNAGYHLIVDVFGKPFIYAEPDKITNGVRGYNRDSLNLCWIGGKGGVDNRTPAQLTFMAEYTRQLVKPSRLGPVPVVGHRDLSRDRNGDGIITPDEWMKLCPAFDVASWLVEIGVK